MRARFVGAGIYEGNYVNGKKSGHGCFTWIDGSRYEVLLRVEELHPRGGGGGGSTRRRWGIKAGLTTLACAGALG